MRRCCRHEARLAGDAGGMRAGGKVAQRQPLEQPAPTARPAACMRTSAALPAAGLLALRGCQDLHLLPPPAAGCCCRRRPRRPPQAAAAGRRQRPARCSKHAAALTLAPAQRPAADGAWRPVNRRLQVEGASAKSLAARGLPPSQNAVNDAAARRGPPAGGRLQVGQMLRGGRRCKPITQWCGAQYTLDSKLRAARPHPLPCCYWCNPPCTARPVRSSALVALRHSQRKLIRPAERLQQGACSGAGGGRWWRQQRRQQPRPSPPMASNPASVTAQRSPRLPCSLQGSYDRIGQPG